MRRRVNDFNADDYLDSARIDGVGSIPGAPSAASTGDVWTDAEELEYMDWMDRDPSDPCSDRRCTDARAGRVELRLVCTPCLRLHREFAGYQPFQVQGEIRRRGEAS